ncbi:MAG TPA: helix-turn-helix transcriptional regulator [Bryobacteraceae bacterium]|jgi:transcriptional regulator with XRE-family HTH domain|nr:helix-turn-helix transcriptional regulator [Bryobacteraceae bacterium]
MAQAISRFRQTLGDTQQQFAHRAGLSVTSVARYETNSPPSPKVLARFVEIAREVNLPAFIEIFENRLEPEEEMDLQDFSAVMQLLRRMVERLHPRQLRQGRLALACLLTPTANLNDTERRLAEHLANAENAVDEAAAELVRGRDPQVDSDRVRFLQTRDLEDWFHFSKAYEAFRAARLAEHQKRGSKDEPLLDMFAIQANSQEGIPFELTQDTVVIEEEEPPFSEDEGWKEIPSEKEIALADVAEAPNTFESSQPNALDTSSNPVKREEDSE